MGFFSRNKARASDSAAPAAPQAPGAAAGAVGSASSGVASGSSDAASSNNAIGITSHSTSPPSSSVTSPEQQQQQQQQQQMSPGSAAVLAATRKNHVRRSTVNGDTLVTDFVPPNSMEDAVQPAPAYLRGVVLQWYNLKQVALHRVSAVVEGEGGLVSQFGFHGGECKAARCAVEGLVADLTGCGGAPPSFDEAVAMLHETIFQNFNRWARMVGAQPVYSVEHDPDRKSILASQAAASEKRSMAHIGKNADGHATSKVLAPNGVVSVSTSVSPHDVPAPASAGADATGAADALSAVQGAHDATSDVAASIPAAATAADQVSIVVSTQRGSDTHTRLVELALYYCIRAEAANLRFMPELNCWLFHQMLHMYRPPPPVSVASRDPRVDASFFHRTTVLPLYQLLKRMSKPELEVPDAWRAYVFMCCRKRGSKRLVKNSARPNYDDMNEFFWSSKCLSITYHSCDPECGIQTITTIPKTFREKSSYMAVFLSIWRIISFLVVLFHALLIVAEHIVDAGGRNLVGLANVNSGDTLIALTRCFETLACVHLVHAVLAGLHALPFGDHGFKADFSQLFRVVNILKGVWAIGWAGALIALAESKSFLGTDLFGGPIWFIVIGARLVCILISEGIFSTCGCSRTNKVRRFFMEMEHIYMLSNDGGKDAVLGWKYMKQPFSRVWKYTLFWFVLLIAKVVFDLHFITQQVRLVSTVRDVTLPVVWDVSIAGYNNAIIVFGSWISIGALYALDSYIAFSLGAAIVGYFALHKDGVGKALSGSDVADSFIKGIGWRRNTPLAEQFVKKCMPLARKLGVDANSVFRRPWDQFVMSLREGDLISNEEQCRLMYGDAVLGVANRLPLFLYAGKLQHLISQAPRIASFAASSSSDADFQNYALSDEGTEEAFVEVMRALPPILTLICHSHSSIGHSDPHVANTMLSLFSLRPSQTMRECVGALLSAEGNPLESCRSVARLCSELMIEFEKESASTRLRGSPLLAVTIALLKRMFRLWNPHITEAELEAATAGQLPAAFVNQAAQVANPSFTGPTLDRLASRAAHSPAVSVSIPMSTRHSAHGRVNFSMSSPGGGINPYLDTRSVMGVIRLLQTPNEGSGRLDGEGEVHIRERYEILLQSARRAFYLLTMRKADATLRVPEAQRRLDFFINSLYMGQMPRVNSVLEMPSFNVVTPQYNEPVVYGKADFLTQVNKHGVSPMVYLKSLHPHEWSNFCERMGVANESEAWKAAKDAQGNPISGEMEVRLWGSMRGQTLARTIQGVMEYVRAIRLLAMVQLELEYTHAEASLPLAARRSRQQIEMDAAAAAQWFVAERFQYVCACQLYSAHSEDDLRRRADIDYMMLTHPLLSVVYFDTPVNEHSRNRVLTSVCRNARGVRYTIPMPGNPIADKIGEGKPENQMNAHPYLFARIVQTLDMNQAGYFEECLKLPNALKFMTVKPTTGRPVVVAGLREHIFTHSLSSSAYFMSQQEYLFGTMWQRIMASPLRVRMHYGHPDIFDKVFMMTRGGTAKASAVVNVSEDIFAGFTAALRGGESEHIEFMQMGKGRDVGMLQIEVFESKISGGTGMSMTTRDSFRIFEGMDFARVLSFYHSCGGFYISNLLIVLSFISTLYYLCSMALTGLDRAVLASNRIYLLGEVNALQWFVQLGLLSVIPLATLYALESGILAAIWRTVAMLLTFSPVFFMFEIQTKAYFYDAALTFGRQCYMGTGRDFVIRHLSFDEIYRSAALSHIYLGMEALGLIILATAFGSFQSVTSYMFFFISGWLFTLSLVFGAFWFNPFALEFKFVRKDAGAWWRWLVTDSHDANASWEAWYNKELGTQYAQANIMARVWRALRISRYLYLLRIIVAGIPPGILSSASTVFLGYVVLAFATIVAYQLVYVLTIPCPTRAATARRSLFLPALNPARRLLQMAVWLGTTGAAVYLGANAEFTAPTLCFSLFAYHVALWWASRIVNIASFWPLAHGTRAAHKQFDIIIGSVMLLVQFGAAIIVPLGAVLHTNLLFSADYANTLEVLTGTRDVLNRHSRKAGMKFLGLQYIAEMEFKRAHRSAVHGGSAGPENRIGIRRDRLRRLEDVGNTPKASGMPSASDVGMPGAGVGGAVSAAGGGMEDDAAGGGGFGGTVNIPGLSNFMNASDSGAGHDGSSHHAGGSADASAAGVGMMGTINIPGLAGFMNAADADAHHVPSSSGAGARPMNSSYVQDLVGTGAAPAAAPRKTLREIMAEFSKPQAVDVKPPSAATAAAVSGKSTTSAGKEKAGHTNSSRPAGRVSSRWPPAKSSGGDDADDRPAGGGLAALRARFEK